MATTTTYVISAYDCGYALERIAHLRGEAEWWLCWDDDTDRPHLLADGIDVEISEASPLEYEVVDTSRGVDPMSTTRLLLGPRFIPFREVTVDGVTWEILVDKMGYPVISRKDEVVQ